MDRIASQAKTPRRAKSPKKTRGAARVSRQTAGGAGWAPGVGTMGRLRALWRGDLPLGEAFWTWAVLGGLLVNVPTSIAFLALVSADLPVLALIVGKGLSLPYNLLATVGVWRSAARSPAGADLCRGAVLVLMAALSLT